MNYLFISGFLFIFFAKLSLATQIQYFIPKYCTYKIYNPDVNKISLRDSGNESAIMIAAYVHEGLKFDLKKGLECWVIIKSPSNTGMIATMKRIMIQPNDKLTFKSGSNPEKVWQDKVDKINDEIVVNPNEYLEGDIFINYNTNVSESDRMGGFEAVITTFKKKKENGECGVDFDCGNERCIWIGLQCDGYNNCGNNKDEEVCSSIPFWVIILLIALGIVVVVLALFVWYRMAQK